MRNLKVEVVRVKERCGDHFFIRGLGMIEIPKGEKVCLFALNSLFPFLTAKQRMDELPGDDWISETEILSCPDPKGVEFKVTALALDPHFALSQGKTGSCYILKGQYEEGRRGRCAVRQC